MAKKEIRSDDDASHFVEGENRKGGKTFFQLLQKSRSSRPGDSQRTNWGIRCNKPVHVDEFHEAVQVVPLETDELESSARSATASRGLIEYGLYERTAYVNSEVLRFRPIDREGDRRASFKVKNMDAAHSA